MSKTMNAAELKAWATDQWNRPGVIHADRGNVFEAFGLNVRTKPGQVYGDYLTKEAKAWRKQFQTYTKSLKPIILAEATLLDGVYTWPKAEKPETVTKPAKPARKSAPRVTKRKIEAVAAILAKLAKEQRAPFLAKWIGNDAAAKIAANDNLTEAARDVLRAAYAA